MQLKFLKKYGTDWTIKDGHIEIIGQYKKDLENKLWKPKLIAGHRLIKILGADKFVSPTLTEAECLGLWKQQESDSADINMLTGQVAEKVIVKHLNQEYGSEGLTFDFNDQNHGNIYFNESKAIFQTFSSLPDYVTESKYRIFEDKRLKTRKLIEIKSASIQKWARDYTNKNYKLEVLNDSLTEDNIVDNPNRDMIKEIYNGLSKKELKEFSALEKQQVENYIKDVNSKPISKKFYVSLIKKHGITRDMILGDSLNNKKPILKNTKNVQVKLKVADPNYGMKRWSKNGHFNAPEEYVYQVSLYTFLAAVKKYPDLNPSEISGVINSDIAVLFLDESQYIVPKDSWINKFDYKYKDPQPIALTPQNFIKIPLKIDLHTFYKTAIEPAARIYKETVLKGKTQDISAIDWAVLKKAFMENGYSLDSFLNAKKVNSTPETNIVKKTVKEYNSKSKADKEHKAKSQALIDAFKAEKEKLTKEKTR